MHTHVHVHMYKCAYVHVYICAFVRVCRCVGETNLATGEASYILGLLHQYFGEEQQAEP